MIDFLTNRLVGLLALFSTCLLTCICTLNAEMLQLSRFQSSIFYIAPSESAVDPYRFKDDALIDDQQSDEFIRASEVEIYLPADHDNYPYSLVDSYLLTTDLVIPIKHESVLYPYPRAVFLSRHDISLSDYTGIKTPPEVYIAALKAFEPFYHQRVESMSMQLSHYHVYQNEYFTESITPGEEGTYMGHLVNGEVYSSGCVAIWVRNGDPDFLLPAPGSEQVDPDSRP